MTHSERYGVGIGDWPSLLPRRVRADGDWGWARTAAQVLSPTIRSSHIDDGAATLPRRHDLRRTRGQTNFDGRFAVNRGPIPQLTESVLSPTHDAISLHERAGVRLPRRDGFGPGHSR